MATKQTAKNTETVSPIPAEWPGAFGLYKHSKVIMMVNVGVFVALNLLAIVFTAMLNLLSPKMHMGDLASFLLGPIVSVGSILLFFAGIKKKQLSFNETVNQALPFWIRMLGLTVLVAVVSLLSILALIIPAFFVIPRLVLAKYFMVDQDMGIMEAYKASWRATEGHIGKVWGIFGAYFVYTLLFITIIGIPFAIYFLVMYSASYAVLYEMVKAPRAKRTTKK